MGIEFTMNDDQGMIGETFDYFPGQAAFAQSAGAQDQGPRRWVGGNNARKLCCKCRRRPINPL